MGLLFPLYYNDFLKTWNNFGQQHYCICSLSMEYYLCAELLSNTVFSSLVYVILAGRCHVFGCVSEHVYVIEIFVEYKVSVHCISVVVCHLWV